MRQHDNDTAWRQRYRATSALLEDTGLLCELWRTVQGVQQNVPPHATILEGADALRQARRVGLITGSFNPLTLAHEELARVAREVSDLDAVVWACAAVTVDKEDVTRATLPDRLAQLMGLARQTRGNAVALMNRGLYVDEAVALRAATTPQTEIFILIGFDKIVQIFDARYYEDRDAALHELFAQARLQVAPRAGSGAEELRALLARPENRQFEHFVSYLDVPARFAQDSSTEARGLAAISPDPRRDLVALASPEGVALACETQAYAYFIEGSDGDTYLLRSRWIETIAAAKSLGAIGRGLPSVARLVACAQESSSRGVMIRAGLLRSDTDESEKSCAEQLLGLCEGN